MKEANDCPHALAATLSGTALGARSNRPGGIPPHGDHEVTA